MTLSLTGLVLICLAVLIVVVAKWPAVLAVSARHQPYAVFMLTVFGFAFTVLSSDRWTTAQIPIDFVDAQVVTEAASWFPILSDVRRGVTTVDEFSGLMPSDALAEFSRVDLGPGSLLRWTFHDASYIEARFVPVFHALVVTRVEVDSETREVLRLTGVLAYR